MLSNVYIDPLGPNIDALDLAIATLRDDRWNTEHRWDYRPQREAAIETLLKLRETLAEEQRRRTSSLAQKASYSHRGSVGFPPTTHYPKLSPRANGYDYYASCECGWAQE
jgi:hypothetical protein